jgi:hypothetical protein
MNHPDQSRRNRGRRRPPARHGASADIWRTPAPLPAVEPITAPPDPTAALRSLGPPPMPDRANAAYHFATVVERAAAIASALALSADLVEHAD